MPQIKTSPLPDRDELDRALKQQKKAAKARERQEYLYKSNSLSSKDINAPPID